MSTKTASFVFRLFSVFLLFTLLFSTKGVTSTVSAGTNVWTSNGSGGGHILALAIDPAASTTLYAGTWGSGVFKSTNDGGNWSPVNTGLTDTWVNALTLNPLTPTTLYAETYSGVFKTTNGGGNWSAINTGLTNIRVNALAIDPATPTILYTGTDGGGVATFNNNSAPFTNCVTQTQIPATECDALVALYNSTNGAGWTNNTGWLQTDTPCSWFGVTCGSGYVTSLSLGSLWNGSEIVSNGLIGTIPTQLGNLTNLTTLDFNYNQLSGSIPPQLGNLTNLTLLDLDNNQLSGSIPTQLGNLTNLTGLHLCGNQLTGSIPTHLGNLTNLTGLYLCGNKLTGPIPTQLGNLTQLNDLVLTANQITGSIPLELGNLTDLRSLELQWNQLTGSIPPQLGNLTDLWLLNLSYNQLSGSIPPQLGNLTNLTVLELPDNRLTGSIPPELGNLTNLTWLSLYNNHLTGSIPTQLGNLTNLTTLYLKSNQLTGSIPPQLGNLTNLTRLHLDNNQLSGFIPPQLGNLTNLTTLYLDSNRLSGEFPTSISNLVNLTTFTFDCWITSTDPSVIAFIGGLVPGWQNSICTAIISIIRDNPNPTGATSLNFTVTFSKPVTGANITDFSLAASDITGASITNVSGSGTTYIVTVGTGIPSNMSIGLININTATLTELDSLPGIGPTIAQRIIDYRTLNGSFFWIEDIMNVSAVGPATFEGIKGLITVGGSFLRLDVPATATISDLAGNPLSGLPFTYGETYTINKNIEVYIGGVPKEGYLLTPGQSTRVNYAGVDSGPVKVANTDGVPIISAIRSAWAVNGVTTSFSQLMGLPLEQLSDTYVFPGYNNVTLNDQVRIANVDTIPTTVTVTIGGTLRGTYPLAAGAAVRINYPGLDSGPVIVKGTSGVKIISSIREAWAVNGVTKSFVQLMGLPAGQLSNKYVFPAYNNVTLNEQLRIGNVDTVATSVTVTIGGTLGGTYPLGPGQAVRINYPGLDSGPVVVEGTAGVNIISSIRSAWAVNSVTTSFSQLMGMPAEQLSNKYLFPAYNNVTLNDQLRIANVDTVPTTVTVTIGGNLKGTYPLAAGEAVRINYPGLDSGPVVVQGANGVKIISSIREAWAVNGVTQSFVQLMGLPTGQLSTTYFFPGYNNITLNEQLRIGMP